MSQTTEQAAVLSSPEQGAAPEQTQEQAAQQDAPPTDTDAAQAAEQAARAAQQAEQAEAEARKQCQATLTALVKAYSKGERAYRAGLLEAGRLCQAYITRRLTLGDKRAPAVQAIEGQLAAVASDTVDVNRLIRCWAAWHLLCDEQGLAEQAKDVPYGHYRDAWCLLLERLDKDSPTERYVLLPGLEAECLATFKAAVDGALSKAAGVERCQALVREGVARAKAVADKAAADKAAAELAARQDAAKAAAEAKAAEQQAAAAEEDAADAAAEAEETQDPAALAEAEQKAKAAAERKAAAKAGKGEDKPATAQPPKPAEDCRAENLLKTAKQGTAKDVAEMVASLITTHPEPDTVCELVLRALAHNQELSGPTRRAVQRTLFILAGEQSGKPAVAPGSDKPAEQPAAEQQPAAAA